MADIHENTQFGWDNIGRDPDGMVGIYSCGSALHKDGTKVYFEYYDFDQEDYRRYDYCGIFGLNDYVAAISQLQEKGSCTLSGVGGRLEMSMQGEVVSIRFSGSPGSAPGGAMIHGLTRDSQRLENLLP